MNKSILILKASKDVCGNEIGLIGNHCKLLGMEVLVEPVLTEDAFSVIVSKYEKARIHFDYIYLCTHGNINGFAVDMGAGDHFVTWSRFSQLICVSGILNPETILLLGCCRGGLFQVATDIMAICNSINFVCGVKWSVEPWDLTTGFVVFLHNIENKKAEPSYAAQKASLATDYTFTCYDRDEVEMMPQFQNRQAQLYQNLGWMDEDGNWIVTDSTINKITGHSLT
jgi:hypothetical protein